MDITEALAPKSDQLDAIELVEPRTFTVDTGSRLGTRDGRAVVEIRLVGLDRVWRPSKGMLDVLADCWGKDGSNWVGRHVRVYNDKDVMFGKEKRGGTRISHLSHIDGPRDVMIRASGAGRTQTWHVEPLPAWLTDLEQAGTDINAIAQLGQQATQAGAPADVVQQIRGRYNAVKADAADEPQ
jgi:hypothetical protein